MSNGHIEQLPSGAYRVRATIDGRRRSLGTYATEEEAERFLAAWRAEVREGAILAPAAVTLRAYGAEWLDRRELDGSALRTRVKSIASERSSFKHICAHPIADMALPSIRRADVEEFVRWLRTREASTPLRQGDKVIRRAAGRPLSRQSQKHVLGLLRRMLGDLVGHSLTANPTEGVRIALDPTSAPRDISEDWLRAEEIDRLLNCDEIPIYLRTAYACAIGLALRLNDLKSVRVEDVDLDCEVPGPHVRVRISKSNKLHRVPVLSWLTPWLRAHLKSLPKGAKWLFPNREGARYSKTYDFKWARKKASKGGYDSALTIAGVDRKIRFHDLRGTCATHLALGTWGRRWSLTEVQQMLAHSDQKVTERYVRRALDMLAEAARETSGGPAHESPRAASEEEPEDSGITGERATGLEPATFSLGS